MSTSVSFKQTAVFPGIRIETNDNVAYAGTNTQRVTVPAALSFTVTARTDATNFEISHADSTHGLTTSDLVDLFWEDGARYGCTISTVDSETLTITGGAGDDIPTTAVADGLEVATSAGVNVDLDLDGDLAKLIALSASQRGAVEFRTASTSSLLCKVPGSYKGYVWASTTGVTNPFAGDTLSLVRLSNASVLTASEVLIGILYDSIS